MKLAAVQRGEILPEERELAVKRMKVADARLKPLGKPMVFDSSFIKPENYGLTPDLMQKVMLELGKIRVLEPLSEDRSIAQAIRATDDLIEEINLLSERLHEWYGVYFPELVDFAVDASMPAWCSKWGTARSSWTYLEYPWSRWDRPGGPGPGRHPRPGRDPV